MSFLGLEGSSESQNPRLELPGKNDGRKHSGEEIPFDTPSPCLPVSCESPTGRLFRNQHGDYQREGGQGIIKGKRGQIYGNER